MAEGKKSFIAYSDWKDTFDALPDDKAGALIKHIFAYVNDEDPQTDDLLINAVFPNIRNALKRDLVKWDNQYQQRVDAGKRSAEVRKRNAALVNGRSVSSTVSVNDSVSVSVNDSVKIKKDKFSFKSSMIELGFEEKLITEWLDVRRKKKATNSETALNGFLKEVEKTGKEKNQMLRECVENSWAGFKSEWINNNNNEKRTSRETAIF